MRTRQLMMKMCLSAAMAGLVPAPAAHAQAIIGKAKRMRREGHFPAEEFKEIKVQESPSSLTSLSAGPCSGVEILWDNGKLIRFQQVEQLIDFLKKVA